MHNVELRDKKAPHRLAGSAALKPSVILPLRPPYRRASDSTERFGRRMQLALAAKRTLDVAASVGLLLALAPIFLLLIVWIPLDSPGSPFFSHERIGLHGRTFWIWKFRTMSRDAHSHRNRMLTEKKAERLLFKHKNDPRVTRFGRFLRKYSLDELPQLFNVLLGEMSLIGPRPLLKEDFEGTGLQTPLYQQWIRDRHRLWPGITGLWQVSGRNELSFEQSMRLDLSYVTQWNVWLDLKILARTLPAILKGHGAY